MNALMLKGKLVDHVCLYIAPLLLGGQNAKGLIGGRVRHGWQVRLHCGMW